MIYQKMAESLEDKVNKRAAEFFGCDASKKPSLYFVNNPKKSSSGWYGFRERAVYINIAGLDGDIKSMKNIGYDPGKEKILSRVMSEEFSHHYHLLSEPDVESKNASILEGLTSMSMYSTDQSIIDNVENLYAMKSRGESIAKLASVYIGKSTGTFDSKIDNLYHSISTADSRKTSMMVYNSLSKADDFSIVANSRKILDLFTGSYEMVSEIVGIDYAIKNHGKTQSELKAIAPTIKELSVTSKELRETMRKYFPKMEENLDIMAYVVKMTHASPVG